MNIVKKFVKRVVKYLRLFYRKIKRKKLLNNNPSIISRDCIGGVIYHDLYLEFLSPTVNLFFEKDDFIKFTNNLFGYLSSEVTEIRLPNVSYPVGEITYKGQPVKIFFMHYKTFEEARDKWNERVSRINKDNIFIINHIASDLTKSDIDKFEALPFKNKVLITYENPTNSKDIKVLDLYTKPEYRPGKVLEYKSSISIKRYIDDFDYVSFFNKKFKV